MAILRDPPQMIILITGGSRGLGASMTAILRDKGHRVLSPPREVLDVTRPPSIERFAALHDQIDVLMNNAGGLRDGFDATMALNAAGPQLVTLEFWRQLRAAKGRIVNISSREGLSGSFGGRDYSAAKQKLNEDTRQHALNNDGVTICACCPGPFDSKDEAQCIKAADTPIWLATEAGDVNGKFYINRQVVPW